MTFSREALSIERAISYVISHSSDDEILAVTGKSTSWFYQCSDPNNDRQISLKQCIALDALMRRKGLVPKLSRAIDYRIDLEVELMGGPLAHKAMDLELRMLHSVKEHADVAESIVERSGRQLSLNDKEAVLKEIDEAEEVLKALRRDVAQHGEPRLEAV